MELQLVPFLLSYTHNVMTILEEEKNIHKKPIFTLIYYQID